MAPPLDDAMQLVRPINYPMRDCQRSINLEEDLADHINEAHSRGGATTAPSKAAPLPCSTIAVGATPSAWADFMTRFPGFCSRLHYTTDNEKTHELLECIPPECYSALSRQHADNLY